MENVQQCFLCQARCYWKLFTYITKERTGAEFLKINYLLPIKLFQIFQFGYTATTILHNSLRVVLLNNHDIRPGFFVGCIFYSVAASSPSAGGMLSHSLLPQWEGVIWSSDWTLPRANDRVVLESGSGHHNRSYCNNLGWHSHHHHHHHPPPRKIFVEL